VSDERRRDSSAPCPWGCCQADSCGIQSGHTRPNSTSASRKAHYTREAMGKADASGCLSVKLGIRHAALLQALHPLHPKLSRTILTLRP
jgi:hypothetical protein